MNPHCYQHSEICKLLGERNGSFPDRGLDTDSVLQLVLEQGKGTGLCDAQIISGKEGVLPRLCPARF